MSRSEKGLHRLLREMNVARRNSDRYGHLLADAVSVVGESSRFLGDRMLLIRGDN